MSSDAPADATPVASTADIASEVFDSYEPSESDAPTSDTAAPDYTATTADTDGDPRTKTEPQPTPAVVAEPLSDEEALLHEFGFKHATKPDGRQHYIPRDKVLKMIASGLKRGNEKWTAEKTPLETSLKEYQAALAEQKALITGDPRQYLSQLAQFDPRYQAFLEEKRQEQAAAPVQMPDPDITLADGSRTYSMEAFQKSILPFIVEQAKAQAKAEAENTLKPLKEREEQETYNRSLRERTSRQMGDLEQMPMFGALPKDGSLTPFQTDVLKALQADSAKAKAEGRRPTMTPKEAYWEVAGKQLTARLAEDDGTKRERIMKEMEAAAKASPTVARAGGDRQQKPGTLSTADIARRVIDQAERT